MERYRHTVTRGELERSLGRTVWGLLLLLLCAVLAVADGANVDEVFGPGDA